MNKIGETLDEWDSTIHPDNKVSTYAELDRHHYDCLEAIQ